MLLLRSCSTVPEPHAKYMGSAYCHQREAKRAAARRTKARLSGGLPFTLIETHLLQRPPRAGFRLRKKGSRVGEERGWAWWEGWGQSQSRICS